ncbi:hypothetical protein [Actinophytocola gossypii]|uniref:Uncharacterized protein n=1 Tax=Actinophytocola gossypii TaxID=2812003 RepID=A0ABT2JEM8_9PSEU|nr:hypothetical protein [Actinophytocola gossypii]MCT2586333.1 hypothetical protein [Actinophytocola gossypii]
MIDVTPVLRRMREERRPWAARPASMVANVLARAVGARVDADAHWYCLVDQEVRIAMVSAAWPLLVATESVAAHAPDIAVLAAPTMDDPVFRCARPVLHGVFGDRDLDPDAFSGNDLWFATV